MFLFVGVPGNGLADVIGMSGLPSRTCLFVQRV